MLKLWCHYASFGKFYKLNVWIVLALLHLKVKAIFAMQPVHLFREKFVFSVTAWYIIHMLKLQYNFGKFYKLNMWIVPPLLYSKVRAIFAMRPVHLYREKFVFSVTARYIVHTVC